MGQFFNQPDFGTIANATLPTDIISEVTNKNSACLYIGTGGDVKVIMNSKFGPNGEFPTASDAITFKNVPDGSFLPVIVDFILLTDTTATDIIAIK
jgi:hypothetical protein